MNKKVKVPVEKAAKISEKLKKYENLNAACKNIAGGIGASFGRMGGARYENEMAKHA